MCLVLENLTKVFPAHESHGEITAVDHISIRIEKGELVTLLGPSGCGKTTTLRLIAGFEFPTQGNIWLDDENINQKPPYKRVMSMVFQSYAIFPHLNVYENIVYGLDIRRCPKIEARKRVAQILEMLVLSGLEYRLPHQLSGGQQQRVALARALIVDPKVLLMDEPLSNLDAKLREQTRIWIRRIQKQLGITTVYVTHDQAEAMALSDRIVVMNEGRIEQVGTPTYIYCQPRTRFVASFVGQANFLEATVRERKSGGILLDIIGTTLYIPVQTGDSSSTQKISLMVRPETIKIDSPKAKIEGIVRRATYLGNVIEYDIEVEGQMLYVEDHEPHLAVPHTEGQRVKVELMEKHLHILRDS